MICYFRIIILVHIGSLRATVAEQGNAAGALRAYRGLRAATAGSTAVSAHPALLGILRGTATGPAPVRAQLARVRPLAAATGTATLIAPLVPVRGLAGVSAGGSQLESVLGGVMRRLARTPGIRLVVIGKEVRTLSVGRRASEPAKATDLLHTSARKMPRRPTPHGRGRRLSDRISRP